MGFGLLLNRTLRPGAVPHHSPLPITSRPTVINQQQSACSKTLDPLPERIQGGVSGRSFRADRSTTRRYSHIASLSAPQLGDRRRLGSLCREHNGSSACAWQRRFFRNNRRWHPRQGCTPILATRSVHQRLIDPTACLQHAGDNGLRVRTAVGRTNYHQQTALDQPLRSCLSPIQLSRC